ncbi:hypothetical protein ABKV19_022722 [Rosa sericea]
MPKELFSGFFLQYSEQQVTLSLILHGSLLFPAPRLKICDFGYSKTFRSFTNRVIHVVEELITCIRGSVVLLDNDGAAALVLASGEKELECNSVSMWMFLEQ